MIHHTSVSLDYMDVLLIAGKSARIEWAGEELPVERQRMFVRAWRTIGYTHAPPCDHVTPDGRCAGHEKGD